jgi:peptide deformylase
MESFSMATDKIVLLGDQRLRETSTAVEQFDGEVSELAKTLSNTMVAAKGLGLAAPQIGIQKRVIAVRTGTREMPEPLTLVNPKLISMSKELVEGDEGCLSIPGVSLSIKRAQSIVVRYQNVDGTVEILEADGLLAICIQHEIDHLNGTLILDHVSRLKRDRAKSQFEKFKRKRDKGNGN